MENVERSKMESGVEELKGLFFVRLEEVQDGPASASGVFIWMSGWSDIRLKKSDQKWPLWKDHSQRNEFLVQWWHMTYACV